MHPTINDFTTDEVVEALICCGQHDDGQCSKCPLRGKYSCNDCAFELYLIAGAVIQGLRARLTASKGGDL